MAKLPSVPDVNPVALVAVAGLAIATIVALKGVAIMAFSAIIAANLEGFVGFSFLQSVGLALLSILVFAKASISD